MQYLFSLHVRVEGEDPWSSISNDLLSAYSGVTSVVDIMQKLKRALNRRTAFCMGGVEERSKQMKKQASIQDMQRWTGW